MSRSLAIAFALALAALAAAVAPAAALEECRLMRMPDIQGDRIVFDYAGDLWTVARAGGTAQRLTSHEGMEMFPKFSPDGRTIAFTAEYDGNTDAYTIPAEGGEPTRLTWHPGVDQVAEWYPDGKSVLIRSARNSAPTRFDRFFKVPATGGFEQMLALPTAGYASFSADGNQIAFVSPSYDRRTWKHYRGGNAPDIWVYDFSRNASHKITDWEGPDEWPMFHGHTVYYSSDQGGRIANLWAYDLDTRKRRQVTQFTEYDVKWPSIGGDAIVFENGGNLWVMDVLTEKASRISVLVPDDKPATRLEFRSVSDHINGFDLSPSAKRAVFEARGELFTVPAEKGDARNLTNTPGARERDPVWSPDGRWIAYLSDKSGEYQFHVIGSDGKTPDRQVTHEGATFRFGALWSPDSRKLLFSDKTHRLWWTDVATGKLTEITHSDFAEIHDYNWSGDSKWVCFSSPASGAGFGMIQLYSLESGKVTAVTEGLSDDFSPAFDPEGKYLFFISRRTFNPEFGTFELDMHFSQTDKLYALSLQDTTASPVAPESDEESPGAADKGDGDDAKAKGGKGAKETKTPDTVVHIDIAGLASRTAELPVGAGRYHSLSAVKGKVIWLSVDDVPDENGSAPVSLHFLDFDKREDKTVLSGIDDGYSLSKDGAKVLYHKEAQYGIVELAADKKIGDGKIETGSLMAWIDPHQEWMQMFNEAWRLERDFYYDPAMGGLDWKAVGARYRQLVPYVAHRADLNYILGELIGELATSHTYVSGGDLPQVPHVGVGLLGADWSLDASGLYRFAKIYRGRDWNSAVHAPLGEPGIGVKEGDLLLEVNGRSVRSPGNLYAAFTGTVDQQTTIKVGSSPGDAHARTYTVKPIASEASLRYVAWVRANFDLVQRATGGRIAYIHVPNTATGGIQEFCKGFYPQVEKQGIIVDERFNAGGFIPDFFVQRLERKTWTYWSNRDGNGFRTPGSALDGPKCILANEYAGSGGDAFPYYFRMRGCGPVIGKRTWGGLVGISHDLPLVDGGSVTMPDFGIYSTDGKWIVENHGVDPDFEVENTPESMINGHDLQLEKAIQYELDQLAQHPQTRAVHPPYKVQK